MMKLIRKYSIQPLLLYVFLSIILSLVNTSVLAADCQAKPLKNTIAVDPLWQDLSYLAADELLGRKNNSEGNFAAQRYLQQHFAQLGLGSFSADHRAPFVHQTRIKTISGTNIVGWVAGHELTEQYIVITAHYDHLGNKDKAIFNGADDNASGTAALLALARVVSVQPLRHSVIFVATDAEELGLLGSQAFVAAPPVPLQQIKYNINLDMLSYPGKRKKLYVAGTKSSPQLRKVIEQTIEQASLCLVVGHDGSTRNHDGKRSINWHRASDHYSFHKQGIPYLFFGVSDHRFYHTTKDTLDRVDKPFYIAAVETALTALTLLDQLAPQ